MKNSKLLSLTIVSVISLLYFILPSKALAIVSPDGYLGKWQNAPYVATLWVGAPGAQYVNKICTAVLISKNEALTAAHCIVSGYEYFVNVKANTDQQGELIKAKRVYTHQRYTEGSLQNDIAYLKLSKNTNARFALLPNNNNSELLENFNNWTMYGSGIDQNGKDYGAIGVLKVEQLNKLASESFEGFNSKTMLGAGMYRPDENIYSGGCSGDSGGPLVVSFKNNAYLIGITSFGAENCDTQVPTVFTRVSFYRDWIENARNFG